MAANRWPSVGAVWATPRVQEALRALEHAMIHAMAAAGGRMGDTLERAVVAAVLDARPAWRSPRPRVLVGPLPMTDSRPGQGMVWIAGNGLPACTAHGAMNRVSATADWWRCLTCNVGAECNGAGA